MPGQRIVRSQERSEVAREIQHIKALVEKATKTQSYEDCRQVIMRIKAVMGKVETNGIKAILSNVLGHYHRDGWGVTKDYDKAEKYFTDAMRLGDSYAKGYLQDLKKQQAMESQFIKINTDGSNGPRLAKITTPDGTEIEFGMNGQIRTQKPIPSNASRQPFFIADVVSTMWGGLVNFLSSNNEIKAPERKSIISSNPYENIFHKIFSHDDIDTVQNIEKQLQNLTLEDKSYLKKMLKDVSNIKELKQLPEYMQHSLTSVVDEAVRSGIIQEVRIKSSYDPKMFKLLPSKRENLPMIMPELSYTNSTKSLFK